MKAHRISVIGASGTGKTTLAKALAEKLGCAHFDSDDYYHYPTDPPYQKQRSPEDRAALLTKDLKAASSWVLSGGAPSWVPAPSVEYSLVVFLYLEPSIRMERLKKRETALYGSRILAGGDMERIHKEFMDWTAGYDDGTASGTSTLAHHEAFLKDVSCPVIRFDKPTSVDDLLRAISDVT